MGGWKNPGRGNDKEEPPPKVGVFWLVPVVVEPLKVGLSTPLQGPHLLEETLVPQAPQHTPLEQPVETTDHHILLSESCPIAALSSRREERDALHFPRPKGEGCSAVARRTLEQWQEGGDREP